MATDDQGAANRAEHIHGYDSERLSPDAAGEGRLSTPQGGIYREAQSERPRHVEFERSAASLSNGTYWSDAEWVVCHDNKARRAKPGVCNVAHGLPGTMDQGGNPSHANLQETDYSFLVKDMIGRVNLWRVTGNAIVPEAAKEVIAAFIDVYGLPSTWNNT